MMLKKNQGAVDSKDTQIFSLTRSPWTQDPHRGNRTNKKADHFGDLPIYPLLYGQGPSGLFLWLLAFPF
ncbi:hypothetical protein RHMOL_Rhmol05G0029600 [Rhododendron molle]|uniref:Uncharacterized protein n=1 Tax=Rhododendron molle TaxID=49168 RepID=A0ACC0NK91_RHOML|nr:hypothetical protein RHMOL_Rhmol05G0029600 [Rhododendron molle]